MKTSPITVANYILLLSFGYTFLYKHDDIHDHKENEPINNYEISSSFDVTGSNSDSYLFYKNPVRAKLLLSTREAALRG